MREKIINKSLAVSFILFGMVSLFTYIVRYPNIVLSLISVLFVMNGVGLLFNNQLAIRIAKIIIPLFAIILVLGLFMPDPDSPFGHSSTNWYRKIGYILLTTFFVVYTLLLYIGGDKKKKIE